MQVDIDESGKIDQWIKPTALAMGGAINRSVYISGKQKKILKRLIDLAEIERQKKGRKKRTEKQIKVRVYAVLLYFLLKDHAAQLTHITIDTDYPGRTEEIKSYAIYLLANKSLHDRIQFGFVGKHSPSHRIALMTFRKKRIPEMRLTAREVFGKYL